jgi:hypothetical protein
VLVRDPEKVRRLGTTVEVVKGDLERPEELAPAFAIAERRRCELRVPPDFAVRAPP